MCPAYHRKERRPAVVLCHSVLRSQYVAQLVVYAQCGGLTVEGGVPSVGVRVRDAEILKKEAASGDYQNHVLENNEKIFQEQIELFRLFFGNTKLSDEQRWEFIEDYFTGMSLEGLKEKYSCVVE